MHNLTDGKTVFAANVITESGRAVGLVEIDAFSGVGGERLLPVCRIVRGATHQLCEPFFACAFCELLRPTLPYRTEKDHSRCGGAVTLYAFYGKQYARDFTPSVFAH